MFMDDQPITDEEELMRRLQMRDAVGQMGNQLASGLAGFAGGPGQQSLAQQDPSAFMNAWYKHSTGLNPANYSENPADYGLATPPPPAMNGMARTPGQAELGAALGKIMGISEMTPPQFMGSNPSTYQHYSATANPMSPATIDAQSNRQYTPITLPNDPPGFFGGLGASLAGMPQQQPMWSNAQGPAAPGQRDSSWRNDGGVMINDGFDGSGNVIGGPRGYSPPGGGYTRQGIDASGNPTFTSVPFGTDADYGARLSTDPYTNPAIQDLIRKQNMAKELQSIGFANDMAKIDRTIGYKEDQSREIQQQKALRAASDPMLSMTAKHAEIDKLQLPEEQKNRMKMEVATTKFDPKSKQYQPVAPPPENGNMSDFLRLIPTGVPVEQQKSFMEEGRGISKEQLRSRVEMVEKAADQSSGFQAKWSRKNPLAKEYSEMVRLGLIKPKDYHYVPGEEDMGYGFGGGGFAF